jgi:hypothetical protein
MDVKKYTFNYRYAGRLVTVTIEATSLEEAEYILSSIKDLDISYNKHKENGEKES